jgi:hypothetical protein
VTGPGGQLFANLGLPVNPDNFLKPGRGQSTNVDDIYALWSLERLAMVCDLKTLAGHDWYAWGVVMLVAHQHDDGPGEVGPPVTDAPHRRTSEIPSTRAARLTGAADGSILR